MKLLVILLLCVATCFAQDPADCDVEICNHLMCPAIKCAPGYITYPVDYPCACCPRCIPILHVGDGCSLPVTANGTCEEQLICRGGLCAQNATTV